MRQGGWRLIIYLLVQGSHVSLVQGVCCSRQLRRIFQRYLGSSSKLRVRNEDHRGCATKHNEEVLDLSVLSENLDRAYAYDGMHAALPLANQAACGSIQLGGKPRTRMWDSCPRTATLQSAAEHVACTDSQAPLSLHEARAPSGVGRACGLPIIHIRNWKVPVMQVRFCNGAHMPSGHHRPLARSFRWRTGRRRRRRRCRRCHGRSWSLCPKGHPRLRLPSLACACPRSINSELQGIVDNEGSWAACTGGAAGAGAALSWAQKRSESCGGLLPAACHCTLHASMPIYERNLKSRGVLSDLNRGEALWVGAWPFSQCWCACRRHRASGRLPAILARVS